MVRRPSVKKRVTQVYYISRSFWKIVNHRTGFNNRTRCPIIKNQVTTVCERLDGRLNEQMQTI